MTVKIQHSLEGISETLLMTLYARARQSQRPNPLIKDDLAVAMVQQINCDFSRLRMHQHDEIAVIMRMNKFDSHVRDFLARHPAGVVVHIGCGLDTRFQRTDNGQVEWFDLDLPDVIDLRQKLIQEDCPRYHTLAASVLESNWLAEVEGYKPRPFLFISEGVLPYFETEQMRSLVLTLLRVFPGCELVCDAHTPFVIWVDNLQLAYAKVTARLHWSIKDGRELESWAKGIRLLEEWNYYQDPDSPLKAYRWIRFFPAIAKSSGIYHYILGG